MNTEHIADDLVDVARNMRRTADFLEGKAALLREPVPAAPPNVIIGIDPARPGSDSLTVLIYDVEHDVWKQATYATMPMRVAAPKPTTLRTHTAAGRDEDGARLDADTLAGPGIVIHGIIGQQIPMEAMGTIDGVPFHFCALAERWSLDVGFASGDFSRWLYTRDLDPIRRPPLRHEARILIAEGAAAWRKACQ